MPFPSSATYSNASISPTANFSGSSLAPQDPDIIDFKNRILANSGTISDTTLAAANEFLSDLKLAGLRSKILRLSLRCGNQLAAALVPLIKDVGFAVDLGTNFTAARYSEATGLNAVGTPFPYINTGVNASTCGISNASCSLGMYILNSAPVANQFALAAVDGTNLQLILQPRAGSAPGALIFDSFGSGTGRVAGTGTNPQTKGFLVGSRSSLIDARAYNSGLQTSATTTSSANNIANSNIYIFRYNLHGNTGEYISAGDFIGLGLNPSEVINLYNIFQVFNTSLGRQV